MSEKANRIERRRRGPEGTRTLLGHDTLHSLTKTLQKDRAESRMIVDKEDNSFVFKPSRLTESTGPLSRPHPLTTGFRETDADLP